VRKKLRHPIIWKLAASVAAVLIAQPALAAGVDTARIAGEEARGLLGDGSGVVIGFVDSGIHVGHPSLAGTVSSGEPRLVAQSNFVADEPGNTGEDTFGHGTAVASQALSRTLNRVAVATDARYINARVLDATNRFTTESQVLAGTGFALANGADILNLSLAYANRDTTGNTQLALMADYITYSLRLPVTVAAGNAGNQANPMPQGPGDAFNIFSVGSTLGAVNWDAVAAFSSFGPTGDGRGAPGIVAPGDGVAVAIANTSSFGIGSGTSYAAPQIAGMLASQIDYGKTHSYSTDPLVLKATLLNSAEKVGDREGNFWEPHESSTNGELFTATSALNRYAGAGQVNGLRLYQQYSPGEMSPGNVGVIGWDQGVLQGTSSLDYHLGELLPGSSLTATLTWFRHVGLNDINGNGFLDGADGFSLLEDLDNLDLFIFRDQTLIAQSISLVDPVEHLFLPFITGGDYTIRVSRTDGGGLDEGFGLAWIATAIPEPGATTLAGALGLIGAVRRRRGSQL
jgi:hypothetical protein